MITQKEDNSRESSQLELSFDDCDNESFKVQASRVTMSEFNQMTIHQQLTLWERLQVIEKSTFAHCVIDRSTKVVKPSKESSLDGISKKNSKDLIWCCYCGSWRITRYYKGYDRCIACGISTKDFDMRKANIKKTNR